MNNNNSILPNFLIVGAAKSGTTSLYNYLKEHPDIFMSEIKEPCFFSSYGVPYNTFQKNVYPANKKNLIRKLENYIELFKDANYKKYNAIGEASTHYLFQHKETISNIQEVYKDYKINYKDIKIIIILRNPVDAVYSNYMMWNMKQKETVSFKRAIKNSDKRFSNKYYNIAYINKFKYYDKIKDYKENFKNVKVFLFDDLKNDPIKLVKNILKFLKVNQTDFVSDNVSSKYNPSGKPKIKLLDKFLKTNNIPKKILKPIINILLSENIKSKLINKINTANLKKEEMDQYMKDYLLNIFEEDIIKTQNLINRNLTDWLK